MKSSCEGTFSTKQLSETIVACGAKRVNNTVTYDDLDLTVKIFLKQFMIVINFNVNLLRCFEPPLVVFLCKWTADDLEMADN